MPARSTLISRMLFALAVALVASAGAATAATPTGAVPTVVDFNRDVRPILSENCFFCHGPDQNKRKAGLRLDTREGLFSAVEGKRFAVVAGKPGESELYKRVVTEDDDDRMPDPKSGKHLSGREIAVLKKWIEQGAAYRGHWAYEKPVRPDLGRLKDEGGRMKGDSSFSPVDLFLLARLREQGLGFSKEAERATLVRRLYLDLLGLPPTPAQVAAFVNDRSAQAYENLVDSLLANPHFGERMAVYWLDLVRFADTIGYHSDNPRDITPYRDWVIAAFNDNMRFDRFTREQLAGDLLPNPTTAQKVASGYNRLLQTTEEGGAQPKEYAAKYNADRVRNVSSVWLAGTMGCAECHDHKFDPYTMKDFYSLAAFFADVREAAVGKREAGMPVPNAEQAREMARLDSAVGAAQRVLATQTPALAAAQAEWEKAHADYRDVAWVPLAPTDVTAQSGAFPKIAGDGSVSITRTVPDKDVYTVKVKTSLKGITAFRVEALAEKKALPKDGPGRGPDGRFVLTGFAAAREGQAVGLANLSASIEPPVDKKKPAAGTYSAASVLSGKPGWSAGDVVGQDQHIVFETVEPVGDGNETTLVFTLKCEAGRKHVLGRFRVLATTAERPVKAVRGRELPKDVVAIIKTDPAKRSAAQKERIASYFRSVTPLLDGAREELAKREKEREAYLKTVPKSLVSVAEAPKTVRLLKRGNWLDESGEVMSPAVPHFLPPAKTASPGARATRLDLADWLVSAENPLPARVYVNRLWKLFFGIGISKSLEDFGAQGEWPTHPELLDWLAVEFRESGWDVKHMVRLLVTSRAYRQSSYASPALKEVDPFNRLVARQGRFRLDAEFVRDNALAISGLLVDRIGGPSVKPYQPDGYWDFLNFPKRTYVHDKGEGEYRRGLYTHWQRTFTHPSLVNFDAPSREECVCERARSNTPQQALTLLNDPTYVEAARAFAERIVREGGADARGRLRWAFATAVQREPTTEELAVLWELFEKHGRQFAADGAAAEAVASAGEAPRAQGAPAAEVAAYASVARTLLNLHEVITRE